MRPRSPLALGAALLVLAVIVAGAAGFAYLFLRPAAPPPVGLASPGASPGAAAPTGSGAPTASGAPAAGLSGTWSIDPSIGSFSDFSSTFVGYRVEETLAGNRANTAVGRTPNVSGSLTLDGTTITSVEVTADMTTLQSDDSRRDGRLRDQAIETARFPTATFRLTGPIDLGSVPVAGQPISASATGELTLHGVTRTVSIPVEATLAGDVVTVTGSIDILFADYSISQPTSFLVLSIEDHGLMELQLHFRRG